MAFWNRKRNKPRRMDRMRPEGDLPWHQRLLARQNLTQLAILVAFFAAALLVVQLPKEPLLYRKDEVTRYPILSRVNFNYVDEKVTANARELAGLRVPSVYRFDPRQIEQLRESVLGLVDGAAAVENPAQLPEAVRSEWPELATLAFGPLKQAIGPEKENLDAVKETLRKTFDALATPTALPYMRSENYDHEVARIEQGNAAAQKLPAGLNPALLERPSRSLAVLYKTEEVPLKLDDVLMKPKNVVGPINEQIRKPLEALLGDKGTARLVGVLASKIGPTLVMEEAERTETENRRTAARSLIQPIRIQVKAGSTLVPAGTPLADEQIQRLEQEEEAYRANLGWLRKAGQWVGAGLAIGLITVIQAIYAFRFVPGVARSAARSFVLAALCLLVLGASKVVAHTNWSFAFWTFFLTAAAMIVTVAYSERFAIAMTVALAVLVAMATRSDLDWIVTALVGTVAAILSLGEINNRSKLIKVGALAGLAFFLTAGGLALWRLQYSFDADRDLALAGTSLLYFASGLAAGFVVLGLLPFIERAFGIVTNISLLELCDVNQPALKRLAIEAPGTYAHSLLIGTLAEAAAEAIGANGLLARVGAYFHDIGKVNKPRYFVENWQEERATHEGLTPQMSRLVITSHVKDGLEMADRLGLPPIIKNFITEHHGTTLVEYFYREAGRREEARGGEAPAEEDYRYPGPKPQSVETAIVMLADAVEGACRSHKEPTAAKIKATVHEMIMKRLLDSQLDSCGMTLSDLHRVEDTLTKTLLSVYHGRIPYPADKAAAEGDQGGPEKEKAPARPGESPSRGEAGDDT